MNCKFRNNLKSCRTVSDHFCCMLESSAGLVFPLGGDHLIIIIIIIITVIIIMTTLALASLAASASAAMALISCSGTLK